MSTCSICKSPQRGSAETAIAQGQSVRSVAKTLNLSYQSLDRHTRNCVAVALAKAAERKGVKLSDRLLEEIEELHDVTREVLTEARLASASKLSLMAIAQARKNIELLARLTGKLQGENDGTHRGITLEELELLYVSYRKVGP